MAKQKITTTKTSTTKTRKIVLGGSTTREGQKKCPTCGKPL